MDSPECVHLIGKGIFHLDDLAIESDFSIYRNPYTTRIVIQDINQETAMSVYRLISSRLVTAQLQGTSNDGRPINASALHPIALDEFAATEGIMFGQIRHTCPSQSRYPLTGYFDGGLNLVYDGWNVEIIPYPNSSAASALSRNWRIPVEGAVLQLRHKDSTMEQHREFARIIMTLLSIASGTGVSCDRHFFTWDSDDLEIWRGWTGDEIGPGPIVPHFEVAKFLEQALPSWQALSREKREALRLAQDYINLSARGYMDTRLLGVLQAWEFLARAWRTKGCLSLPEANLRDKLLEAKKSWNENHPGYEIDGFWNSRIASIFDWPKLRDAIEQFAVNFGLSLKQVGLDLDALKKARDSVAHSGKLTKNINKHDRQSLDLLLSGQYCLQLLLLRILTYRGKVCHSTAGISTTVDIDEALLRART